ncbi:hypothetical protein GQ55_2G107900 [Panicum hallii var. hallii]|uniref:CCHC-type domain-containing protein n=1 Tax=Panicum hallii var. hallii TaxID=1504633 RepID=A0A2T7ENM4_9POAL|nr:hypothetical protein GQ55_2G107900 [Panicum hallii var. hallii]
MSKELASVEGMLERMQLSAAERKGIKVEAGIPGRAGRSFSRALGKVMAEKLVNAEGLAQALGKIWCPIKGINCKDLGDNRRPLIFGKDLVVMVELDEMKTLEEVEFAYLSIWIRAMKMPFGMMNKATGKAIGSEVGEFMVMELEDDETVVRQFLRIKCPLVYEFLPDFCYTCGRIRHMDKNCEVVLKDGEKQQFSKCLRFIPEKKRWDDGGSDRSGGGRYIPPWRNSGRGSGHKLSGSRSGSDSLSWKKDDMSKGGKKGSSG